MSDLSRQLHELEQALQWVSDRSKGFTEEPDLTPLAVAVHDLLQVSGRPTLLAFDWERFEREGRADLRKKAHRREQEEQAERERYPRL